MLDIAVLSGALRPGRRLSVMSSNSVLRKNFALPVSRRPLMYLSSLQISGKSGLLRGSNSQHLFIKEASLLGHPSGSSGRRPALICLSRPPNGTSGKGSFLVRISEHTIAKLYTSALKGLCSPIKWLHRAVVDFILRDFEDLGSHPFASASV